MPSTPARSASKPYGADPRPIACPVRATASVLADIVGEAGHELLLMTYSARPHAPLTEALRAAAGRAAQPAAGPATRADCRVRGHRAVLDRGDRRPERSGRCPAGAGGGTFWPAPGR